MHFIAVSREFRIPAQIRACQKSIRAVSTSLWLQDGIAKSRSACRPQRSARGSHLRRRPRSSVAPRRSPPACRINNCSPLAEPHRGNISLPPRSSAACTISRRAGLLKCATQLSHFDKVPGTLEPTVNLPFICSLNCCAVPTKNS